MAFGGILFTAWIPIGAALRYLKVHHLGGVPHMIFDVGTGIFLLSVLLLSAFHDQRLLYLLILLAIVMLTLVQSGGYIAEERNVRAAQEKTEAFK